jgi:predicted hydrocarbon binding protein
LAKTKHGMLTVLEKNIELLAGITISKRAMEGSEEITEKTDKRKMAEWVKAAMERLCALVDEKTRVQIMENCGYNCAEINRRVIERAKARRNKFKNIDEFLEAEQRKPTLGTMLAREGKTLYQFYIPKEYARPMRCYCPLLRGLPEDEKVSPTYCHCSKAFLKKFWETILERPVRVELMESVVSGGSECKFSIHIAPSILVLRGE